MANQKNTVRLPKGFAMEETLRNYFNSLGFFTVRGIPFVHDQSLISDIDLWLYNKSSAITRERINVDSKNKKQSQARERIVWTKGVQEILGLDKCIVATKDSTPVVRQFGISHGVVVMSGEFLATLSKTRSLFTSKRLSEEDFKHTVSPKSTTKGNSTEEWYSKIEIARGKLLERLNFAGLNHHIQNIEFFLKEAVIESPKQRSAIRALCCSVSYFLITVDFLQIQVLFLDDKKKKEFFTQGMTYGDQGENTIKDAAGFISLIDKRESARRLEYKLKTIFEDSRMSIVIDYITKSPFLKTAFDLAKKFDSYTYGIEDSIYVIDRDAMNLIYIFCDYFKVKRASLPIDSKAKIHVQQTIHFDDESE